MGKIAKVTSKGQVTIPKEIRDHLNSQVIEFEIEDDKVVVRPVKRVAGNLKRYANPDFIPREKTAWEKAVKDKYENR